jgi:hypothetical protein
MKSLKVHETKIYLQKVGIQLGKWNELRHIADQAGDESNWINHQAPRDAETLYCFSLYAAGWLRAGNWKMLQIDNSNYLDDNATRLLGRLLFGPGETPDFSNNNSFLFEFTGNAEIDGALELTIAEVIHLFLQVEGHCYIVSSNSNPADILGIQDGFTYFISRSDDLSGARILLRDFQRQPRRLPTWASRIISARQNTSH